MTSLQSLILSAIRHHGPQSIMSLWHHASQCQPLAGVVVAVGELSDDGFIEKTTTHAAIGTTLKLIGYWQLTEKGQQYIAAQEAAPCNTEKEVCLGS